MDNRLLEIVLVLMVLLLNLFWYSAKSYLRANGRKSDWAWKHLRDFSELKILMGPQYTKAVNSKASLYYYGIPAAILGCLLILLFLSG